MMLTEWLQNQSTTEMEDVCDDLRTLSPIVLSPPKRTVGGHKLSSFKRLISIFSLPKAPDRELKKQRCELCSRNRQRNGRRCAVIRKQTVLETGRVGRNGILFKGSDPASPEVSCVGRIKQKHRDLKSFAMARRQTSLQKNTSFTGSSRSEQPSLRDRTFAWYEKLFRRAKSDCSKKETPMLSVSARKPSEESVPASCPSLSQLRAVSSSRREPESLGKIFI